MKTINNTEKLFSRRAKQLEPSFIREILKSAGQPGIISFAGGLPESSLFPLQQLADSAYRVLKDNGREALQYTNTEGYMPLRKFIAERYWRKQKIIIDPEQILITSGSQQALDLIGKLFLDPGDSIALERPSYLGAMQCFTQYQPLIHEIDLGAEGPDENQIEQLLKSVDVKFFYTIPNFHNPTGKTHSFLSRMATANVFSSRASFIIEDDPYGEIRFDNDPLPSYYSLLPEQTIALGTFSKMIVPGLRIGWVVARPDIIKKLAILKQASDLHSSHVDQQILFDYLTTCNLDEHIDTISNLYRSRRDCMKECIDRYFPDTVRYIKPDGGMFLWLEFQGIDTMQLLQKSMKEGIVFVPGESFYVRNPVRNTARFNFSNAENRIMKEALLKLGDLTYHAFEMKRKNSIT